ncbi:MAG: GNAT family N-acetyltransferase [Candidatus Pacebacteria bacterium]|nr:GNAT family N-acetyltransferase [Candidatus Paceibacterota bacterium]
MPRKVEMQLVKPNLKYKDSFLKGIKELQAEGNNILPTPWVVHFEEYVARFEKEEQGIDLPEGYVSHSRFWLIDNEEFIGHVDIRHKLTDDLLKFGGHIGYAIVPSKRRLGYGTKILEMALPIAKELGIEKVFFTLDDSNIASAKIIEKNGGVLESKIEYEGVLKRRYWITLK